MQLFPVETSTCSVASVAAAASAATEWDDKCLEKESRTRKVDTSRRGLDKRHTRRRGRHETRVDEASLRLSEQHAELVLYSRTRVAASLNLCSGLVAEV
jgi:hypothetical protein